MQTSIPMSAWMQQDVSRVHTIWWRLQGGSYHHASVADQHPTMDLQTAANLAATTNKEVMLAVANRRAVVTLLPTLLLR